MRSQDVVKEAYVDKKLGVGSTWRGEYPDLDGFRRLREVGDVQEEALSRGCAIPKVFGIPEE